MSESDTPKQTSRTGLRCFFISTIKLALVLVIAALILAGIGAGIGTSVYYYRKSYAKPQAWTIRNLSIPEKTPISLTTKWEGGYLYYQLNVLGYPQQIKDSIEGKLKDYYSITIEFYDLNGFVVDEHKITLNEFVRLIDENGDITGLAANSSTYMDFGSYKKAVSWSIKYILSPKTSDISEVKITEKKKNRFAGLDFSTPAKKFKLRELDFSTPIKKPEENLNKK